jgi:hypothetical protein
MFLKRFSVICLLGICLAVFACKTPSSKAPKEAPKNVEAFIPYEGHGALLPHLYLYTDGNGNYLAMAVQLNPLERQSNSYPYAMFWGDGNVFFEQTYYRGEGDWKEPGKLSEEADAFPDASLYFEVFLREPRTSLRVVRPKEGALYVACGESQATLQPVPAEEARAMVEKAQFYEQRFQRGSHLLARDDEGTYYYIGKSTRKGEEDFRLFIGKEGQMKPLQVKNILQDSAGEIFQMPEGSLHVALDGGKRALGASWKRGKETHILTNLPVRDNVSLIFGKLGIYAEQKFGTPCDVLPY